MVFSIKIPGGHRLHAKRGLDNQLGEIRARASAGQGQYRGTLQNGGGNCDSAGGQDHQYLQPGQDDSEVLSDISQKLSQTVGATQQQHTSIGMGEIVCEVDTALPAGPLEIEQRGPSRHDSRQGSVKATSQNDRVAEVPPATRKSEFIAWRIEGGSSRGKDLDEKLWSWQRTMSGSQPLHATIVGSRPTFVGVTRTGLKIPLLHL